MSKRNESRILTVLKRIFKVGVWFDWKRMKSFSLYLANALKLLFLPQELPTRRSDELIKSFEQAQKEQHLTDGDLEERQKALLLNSLLMLCFAVGLLMYALYQFWCAHIKAGLISSVVMGIAFALAFRYHFWYFQIKSRRLGCSVQEWLRNGLLGRKE